jgi:hypothetical protein
MIHQRPDESWSLNRIAQYVLLGIEKIARLDAKAKQLNRREAVEVHRIGYALSIARKTTTPLGQWGKWLTKHRIPRTTAWEAIKLYESASEEEMAKLTITEAKMKFGIYPEFQPSENAEQSALAREVPLEPDHQLALMHRRLKSVTMTINSIEWQKDLLWSVEVDEVLTFCKEVVRTINQKRKKVQQPKPENTKRFLANLRSL